MDGLEFFTDTPDGEETSSTIEVAKLGSFRHPKYGRFAVTAEKLDALVRNFEAQTTGTDLMVDEDHSPEKGQGTKAAGWFKRVYQRGDRLLADVEWTKVGAAAIRDKIYRYISPTISWDYSDEGGTKRGPTLIGAGLTNRPFFSLPAVSLSRTFSSEELMLAEEEPNDAELAARAHEDDQAADIFADQLPEKTAADAAAAKAKAAAADARAKQQTKPKPKQPAKDGDFEGKHPRGGGGLFVTKGSEGDTVKRTQKAVGADTDGKFGAKTETAVRAFQKRHGLQVDGVVGRQTAAAILGHKEAGKVKVGALTAKQTNALAGKKPTVRTHSRDQETGDFDEPGAPQTFAAFNPADHPRDPLGRFTSALKKLPRGGKLKLPGGVTVNRDATHLNVKGPGKKTESHRDPTTAALRALDLSARSSHPDSVGGKQSFPSFQEAKRAIQRSRRKKPGIGESYVQGGRRRSSITRPFLHHPAPSKPIPLGPATHDRDGAPRRARRASDSRPPMDRDELIQIFGLEADASDDEILTAAREAHEATDGDVVILSRDEHTNLKAKADKAPQAGEMTLSREAVEKLQADASAGAEAAKQLREQTFDTAFTKAVDDVRVAPAERETFEELYEDKPDLALKMLAERPKLQGVQTKSRGGTGDGDAHVPDGGDPERFEQHQLVEAYATEHQVDYVTALERLDKEGALA